MKIQRFCLECGTAFSGRADKKFCSDHCRCQYNNKQHRFKPDTFRSVNSILRSNYSILQRSLGSLPERKVRHEDLQLRGFRFPFVTHIQKNPASETLFGLYDLQWVEKEDGEIIIRRGLRDGSGNTF